MNKTTNSRYYYAAGFCWLRILTVTAFFNKSQVLSLVKYKKMIFEKTVDL